MRQFTIKFKGEVKINANDLTEAIKKFDKEHLTKSNIYRWEII